MREVDLGGRPVLVLREAKPLPPKGHTCPVYHGDYGARRGDNGAIIQCACGKRYRCRKSWAFDYCYVWVRRILPWPPKQAWPADQDWDKRPYIN